LDVVYITIDSMNYFFNEKIIKFGVVGVSGMAIDFSVTWLLKEKLKANKYIANSAGFSCAVVSNFILNNIWTFAGHDSGTAKRFCLFIIIAAGGILISNISLYFLLKYVKINFYLLKLVVTGIVFFWNYFLNLTFTFN
jgi:putative flippase GtrA